VLGVGVGLTVGLGFSASFHGKRAIPERIARNRSQRAFQGSGYRVRVRLRLRVRGRVRVRVGVRVRVRVRVRGRGRGRGRVGAGLGLRVRFTHRDAHALPVVRVRLHLTFVVAAELHGRVRECHQSRHACSVRAGV